MAKDNDLDDDLDNDDFGGFDDDFDDFGGSMESEPPPKNAREAVSRSMKNTTSSFVEDFTDDKFETANEILKKSVPESLSKENDAAVEAVDTVKDEYEKAKESVKREAKTTFTLLKKIAPESEKVQGILDKIGDTLDLHTDPKAERGPSKEEIEKEKINTEIITALGEKNDADKRKQLLNDQIEVNRHKTNIELANLTVANLTSIRKFNNQITNDYYRKSLEISLKSLFVQKENLEVIKTGFDLFKNQFESIVQNTGLPDMLKVRSKEALVFRAKQRSIDGFTTAAIGDQGILGGLKKNIEEKAEITKDIILEKLQGANGMLEMATNDDLNMSKEQMIATLLAGMVKDKAGSKLSNLIEKSDTGKEYIGKTKDYMNDLSYSLKRTAQESGVLGGPISFLADMVEKGKRENVTVGKKDLNDVTIFDNRAKDSLIKTIPGLLAKIHNEVSAIRKHNKIRLTSDTELRWDNRTDTFISKANMLKNVNDRFERKVTETVGMPSSDIIDVITKPNIDKYVSPEFTTKEKKLIREQLFIYANSKQGNNAGQFIKLFPKMFNGKLAGKLTANLNKIGKGPQSLRTVINNGLNSLQTANKQFNFAEEIKEMSESGNSDIIERLNVTKKDKLTGQLSTDNTKLDAKVQKALNKINDTTVDDLKKKEEKEKLKKEEKKTLFGRYGKDDKEGLSTHAVGGIVKLSRTQAIQYAVYKYKLKRVDAQKLYNKLKIEDIVTRGTIDEAMNSDRYTGNGSKDTEAGIVHKGEYVITKKNVHKLVTDIAKGEYKGVKDIGDKIAKDSKKAYKHVKDTSAKTLKYAKDTSPKVMLKDATKLINKISKQIPESFSKAYASTSKITSKYYENISKLSSAAYSNSKKMFTTASEYINKTSFKDMVNDGKVGIETGLNKAKENEYVKSGMDKVTGLKSTSLRKLLTPEDTKMLRTPYRNLVKRGLFKGKFEEFLKSDISISYMETVLASKAKSIGNTFIKDISSAANRRKTYIKTRDAGKDAYKTGKEYINNNSVEDMFNDGKELGGAILARGKHQLGVISYKLLNADEKKKFDLVYKGLFKQGRIKLKPDEFKNSKFGGNLAKSLIESRVTNNETYKAMRGNKYVDGAINDINTAKGFVNEQAKKSEEFIKTQGSNANEYVKDKLLTSGDKRALKKLYKTIKGKQFLGTYDEFLISEQGKAAISRLRKHKIDVGIYNTEKTIDKKARGFMNKMNSIYKQVDMTSRKHFSKEDKAALKRKYDIDVKKNGYKGTYLDWVKTDTATDTIRILNKSRISSKLRRAKDNPGEALSYAGNSFMENLHIAKQSVSDRLFKNKYDGVDFVKDFKDLTDKEQEALRSSFFSSSEYRGDPTLTFNDWLARSKSIRPPGMNDIFSKLMTRFNPISKKLTQLHKLKDEVIDEIMGKVTGTGLREVSLAQEDSMREEFFSSNEYKDGHVDDFDSWLKTFGYRRNGTGILGRLKKKLSIKNILKHTRAFDKKVAYGAGKLVGKGLWGTAKGVVKSPLTLLKGGAMATRGLLNVGRGVVGLNKLGDQALGGLGVMGEYVPTSLLGKVAKGGLGLAGGAVGGTLGALGGLGKHALGGVASVPNTFLKSATGFSLAPDDIRTNLIKAKKLVNNPFPNEDGIFTKGKNAIEKAYYEKVMGVKKGKETGKQPDKVDELIQAVKDNKVKEKKHVAGDADGDGIRDGSWKNEIKDVERLADDDKGKKKNSFIGLVAKKAKGMSFSTMVMLGVGAIAGTLTAMGTTMKDVKDGISLAGDVLSGIWGGIKWIGNKLGSLYNTIKHPFGGKDEEEPELDEQGEPIIGPDGKPVMKKADSGLAKYGVAGAALVTGGAIVKKATLGLVDTNKWAANAVKGTVKGAKYVGEKAFNAVKGTPKVKPKIDLGEIGKKATKVKPKKAGIAKKIIGVLKRFKNTIFKKFGKKAGKLLVGKLMAKIAARAVPFLGWTLLLWDAGWVIKYMADGMSLKSAISKQILGFDLFSKHDTPDDLDMSEEEDKAISKENITTQPANNYITKPVSNPVYKQPVNNTSYVNTEALFNDSKTTRPPKKITTSDILKEFKESKPFDKGQLLSDLVRDEGIVLHKYKDSLGYDTIGVGHLTDRSKGGKPIKPIIGRETDKVTEPEAYKILASDANTTTKELYNKLPWLSKQPEVVQRSLVNMGFNLGVTGLLKFKRALAYIKSGNYTKGSLELRNSKWYRQVGVRAMRIVNAIAGVSNKHVLNNTQDNTANTTTPGVNTTSTRSVTIAKKQEVVNKVSNLDMQQAFNSSKVNSTNEKHLIDSTSHLKESLRVQTDMLQVLGEISHRLNNGIVVNNLDAIKIDTIEKEKETTTGSNSQQREHQDLPRPIMDLSRRKFA